MWHRRGALLARGERLERLAHLGALEVADLEGEPLERGADAGDRVQEGRVPVAGDDLGRHRLAIEAEGPEGRLLDAGIGVGVGAHSAGQLSDADAGERSFEPHATAAQLAEPAEQLQAERGRLGMHAVRAADRRRMPVLLGACAERDVDGVDALEQDPARVSELERQRRVDDVRRGEAVVEPAPVFADLLGDRLGEGQHVVVRAILDLADAGDIDARPLTHGRNRVGRHDSSSTQPAIAAISTSSHRVNRRSSDQTAPMAGRV